MTKRECAIVEAYTGTCMLQGEDRAYFYEYLEELFGHPVFTHELADVEFSIKVKAKAYPDFIELCAKSV